MLLINAREVATLFAVTDVGEIFISSTGSGLFIKIIQLELSKFKTCVGITKEPEVFFFLQDVNTSVQSCFSM